MKHEIVITAQGHKGTLERLQNEFSAIKLWEAADRDAALKAAAPRLRGLAHFGHAKVDGKLMDALPKLEIISNFGVGVDQIDLAAAKKRSIL
ncbi:MAG: 2-hydroxyacid dehydrogenase, partial [Burkholderiales bacterium]